MINWSNIANKLTIKWRREKKLPISFSTNEMDTIYYGPWDNKLNNKGNYGPLVKSVVPRNIIDELYLYDSCKARIVPKYVKHQTPLLHLFKDITLNGIIKELWNELSTAEKIEIAAEVLGEK